MTGSNAFDEAAFHDYVDRAPETAASKAREQQLAAEICTQVWEAAQDSGLEIIMDPDDDVTNERIRVTIDELSRNWLSEFRDSHTQAEIDATPNLEERLRNQAEEQIRIRVHAEDALLGHIAVLLYAYRIDYDAGKVDMEKTTSFKKHLQAELRANSKYSGLGPEWLEFVSEVVPGEDLDLDNPDDLEYIFSAVEKDANREHAPSTILKNKALEILGIVGEDMGVKRFGEQEVKHRIQTIGQLFWKTRALRGNNAAANRSETLHRLTVQAGFTQQESSALIALFEAFYAENPYP